MKVKIGPYPKDRVIFNFFPFNRIKRDQRIKVHIDPWDTWSMDNTLAHIILPMLKQLKEHHHGAPDVADKDVPKELRRAAAPSIINEWDTDENYFKRWEWVLDEMIYAFETQCDTWAAEEKFSSGVFDMKMVNTTTKAGDPAYTFEEGPNHTYKTDKKALAAHHKRVKNGLRLFGTYYQGLWD